MTAALGLLMLRRSERTRTDHRANGLWEVVHNLPFRVATKFAVALTGGALLLLGVVVTLLSLHERRELIHAAHVDLKAEGDALAPILGDVWRRDGELRARDVLHAAAAANINVGLDIQSPGSRDPSDPPSTRDEDGRVVVHVPIVISRTGPTTPGETITVHSLRLERRVPTLQASLLDAAKVFLLAALPLAAFAMLTAYALGEWLVGRPLRRVAEHTRRIGSGDLDSSIDVRGSPEIRKLKMAINQMSRALNHARATAQQEQAERIEAVKRLRHADRLTSVGTLAAGIAHELGTPLNVILLESRIVERAAAKDPARVERGAQLIRNQTGRMTAIVRQLLGFARRREPLRSWQKLNDVVSASVMFVSSLARTRNCIISVSSSSNVEPEEQVFVDAGAIQQALVNLLINAFDSMPNGGRVQLTLARSEAPTTTRDGGTDAAAAAFPGPWVTITVQDEGVGMDEATQARLFEPFFTTKDVGKGTGLGLAVTRGIVEDHHGFVEVRSEVGRGTTFTVHLPIVMSPPKAAEPDDDLTSAKSSDEDATILLC